MYLFFDTETTGLPKDWKAPLTELDNWPRLVQLAWRQYDKHKQLQQSGNVIIKPVGFDIPFAASNVHGISTQQAIDNGINLKDALIEFNEAVRTSSMLIAHNMSFDEKIIGAEYLRCMPTADLNDIQKICTKEKSTLYCAIPGKYGYKWPTLMELHEILFEERFENAHDALADVKACADCFFELHKRGVILL